MKRIRCDGFVEYCYEKNNFRVWRNQDYADSTWSIVLYPDLHNDRPDIDRDPNREASPWAQRGAPCATGPQTLLGGCSYFLPDTKMTSPAVVHLPTVQVTTNGGPGYLDATIRATDESGIHLIGCIKPGETNWTISPTQPQHPTSDSYAWTVRIMNSGTLRVDALDNGGNESAFTYTITVASAVPFPPTANAATGVTVASRLDRRLDAPRLPLTVLRQFGLIENDTVENFLATVFSKRPEPAARSLNSMNHQRVRRREKTRVRQLRK
jgi:hypothetical protein